MVSLCKYKLVLLDQGTKWLSPEPDKPFTAFPKPSDGLNRIFTFAVLKNIYSNVIYFHINTHLDYKYAQAYQELNQVKSRNEILEKMQSDYINSKNQIIFLLQQIDLYKKDNKKQKEQLEKLIFTHQNTIQQKEQNDNIKKN